MITSSRIAYTRIRNKAPGKEINILLELYKHVYNHCSPIPGENILENSITLSKINKGHFILYNKGKQRFQLNATYAPKAGAQCCGEYNPSGEVLS